MTHESKGSYRKSLRERATSLMERYAAHMAPRPYDELLEDMIDELRLVVAETSISVAADTRQTVLARTQTTSTMLDEEIEHLAQKASAAREASALVARRHDAQVKSLRARVYQLETALAEISDDGCDTKPYATNCDGKCKDIARAAILTAPVVELTS